MNNSKVVKQQQGQVANFVNLPCFEDAVDPDTVAVDDVYHAVVSEILLYPEAKYNIHIVSVKVANYHHGKDEARLMFDCATSKSSVVAGGSLYQKAFTVPNIADTCQRIDFFHTRAAARRAHAVLIKMLEVFKG